MKLLNSIVIISLLATQPCIGANDNMLSMDEMLQRTTNEFQRKALDSDEVMNLIKNEKITLDQFFQINNQYQMHVLKNSNVNQLIQDKLITWAQFMQIYAHDHSNTLESVSPLLRNNTITWDQFMKLDATQRYVSKYVVKHIKDNTITWNELLQINNQYQAYALKESEILIQLIKDDKISWGQAMKIDNPHQTRVLKDSNVIQFLQNDKITWDEFLQINNEYQRFIIIQNFQLLTDGTITWNQAMKVDNKYQVSALTYDTVIQAIKNCKNIFNNLLFVDSDETKDMLANLEVLNVLNNVDTTLQEICHIYDRLQLYNLHKLLQVRSVLNIEINGTCLIEKFSAIPDNKVSKINNLYQIYALKKIYYDADLMDSLTNGSISWDDIINVQCIMSLNWLFNH